MSHLLQHLENVHSSKVYSSFMDNICGAHLANMQLINKYDKGIRFLLSVFNVFGRYPWTVTLKDKNGITATNLLQKVLDKLAGKLNKIWLYKGSKFCNRSMKFGYKTMIYQHTIK